LERRRRKKARKGAIINTNSATVQKKHRRRDPEEGRPRIKASGEGQEPNREGDEINGTRDRPSSTLTRKKRETDPKSRTLRKEARGRRIARGAEVQRWSTSGSKGDAARKRQESKDKQLVNGNRTEVYFKRKHR